MKRRHSFFTRISADSMADAETKAHEACRAYFGDSPYEVDISTTTRVTMGGEIVGYEVAVDATAVLGDLFERAAHEGRSSSGE